MEYKGEYYCTHCFHTEQHAEIDDAHATDCQHCGEGKMRPNFVLGDLNPLLFRRAGWGDNVSTWEEIKWRHK